MTGLLVAFGIAALFCLYEFLAARHERKRIERMDREWIYSHHPSVTSKTWRDEPRG